MGKGVKASVKHFQFIRLAENSWEVHTYVDQSDKTTRVTSFELIARILLDTQADRFYIERVVWKSLGKEWVRLPKTYLTREAAFRALTHPTRAD